MMGEGLDASSIEELQQLENQLDRSLMKIRAKKYQLLREETEKLKEKVTCSFFINLVQMYWSGTNHISHN
jgi:hypothetical protein